MRLGRVRALMLVLAVLLPAGCSKRRDAAPAAIPIQEVTVPVLGTKDTPVLKARVMVPAGFVVRSDQFGLYVKRPNYIMPLLSLGAQACVAGLHGDACLDAMEQSNLDTAGGVRREKLRPGVMRITWGTIETLRVYHAGTDTLVSCTVTQDHPDDVALGLRACAELTLL